MAVDGLVSLLDDLSLKKLIFLVLFFWARAALALQVHDDMVGVNLTESIEVLEDVSGRLTLEQVQSPEFARRFVKPPSTGASLNLGFTASTYWLRFPLSKTETDKANWVLQLNYPALDVVEFYPPYGYPVITGRSQPIASRPLLHRFFVFPLQLQPQEQFHYLRVATQGDLTVPLTLSTAKEFFSESQRQLGLQFLYYGGLFVLCLYNLFVYYFVREKLFLVYAAYACALGMGMMAGNGFSRLILWPDWLAFDMVAQNFFFCLAGGLLALLTRGFVAARRGSIFALACAWTSAIYFLIAAILLSSVWLHFNTMWVNEAMMLCGALGVLVIVSGVFVAWRRGRRGLRFFMASWLVLALGIFAATGRMVGFLPTNGLTAYALQISSVFEMFFLFLALADQWYLDRQQRMQAQKNEMEIRDLYAATLRMAKERLEETVKDRTEQLELALANERQTLAQYVRFGAMISHEFRNPLAIINSQLSLMHKEHEHGQLQLDQRLSILGNATRRLVGMFDKWLQSDRMSRSLDEIAPHALPLSEWLRHWVQTNAHGQDGLVVELQLDESVGNVLVDEYLLEIAVCNLLENARKYAGIAQPVVIETRMKPGFVGIAVVDRGPGIAVEHQADVFKDYFRVDAQSTEPGVGLGLPIVRRIARAHGGDLELHSESGQGCSFCIWLPDKSES